MHDILKIKQSGAGKTENTKKVIMYFAKVAASLGKKDKDDDAPSEYIKRFKVTLIFANRCFEIHALYLLKLNEV
jgi:myosin heavy subunit